jgi:nucleoside-diphosphate-sugar epimerase
MRIFLAGASGVVGRRIVRLLVDSGHLVTGLTRRPRAAAVIEDLGGRVAVADVYDANAIGAAVRAAKPDVLIHQLTDLSAGDRSANAKVRDVGTRNLIDAALSAGVDRVVAQSIAWAYEPGEGPATEAVALDLHADAARSDTVGAVAALEKAVSEVPEWVVLRYGMFYGPDTWYDVGGLMAESAKAGQLPAGPDVTSFIHVDDAAAAAVSALAWPSGIVNVCDDEPATGHQWLPMFCKAVGAPEPGATDEGATWARGADNRYARTQLNWTPRWTTWRDGFAHMAHVPRLPRGPRSLE